MFFHDGIETCPTQKIDLRVAFDLLPNRVNIRENLLFLIQPWLLACRGHRAIFHEKLDSSCPCVPFIYLPGHQSVFTAIKKASRSITSIAEAYCLFFQIVMTDAKTVTHLFDFCFLILVACASNGKRSAAFCYRRDE